MAVSVSSGQEPNVVRRAGLRVLVITAGLAAGLGATWLVTRSSPPTSDPAPSIDRFSFTTVAPAAANAPDAPVTEPTPAPDDPAGALAALLRSEQEGRAEEAWFLLDAQGRARYPTPAAWGRARSGRPAPVTFEIGGTQPGPDGAVDVTAMVTWDPSLDPFAGLVTTRGDVVWRAHREGDAWRLAAEPESTRLHLPSDDGAAAAVRDWVAAVRECDAARARTLQAIEILVGPADLASAPCRLRGDWTIGDPSGLAASSDTAALQAAFGADVTTWARVVPVRSASGTSFFAALAPVGDDWRVMGVTTAP